MKVLEPNSKMMFGTTENSNDQHGKIFSHDTSRAAIRCNFKPTAPRWPATP